MPNQIALLRGINVGGRNLVAMSKLRDLLEGLGFTNVRSLLQSGNLVFASAKRSGAILEKLLETETKKHLAAAVDYIVRTVDEWEKIIAANPFPVEAINDPSHLVVVFLKRAPAEIDVNALQAASKGPEVIHAVENQLYVTYPSGIGKSKLTNALIERKLGIRGTARNWNTVMKLAEMSRK
jgi:uncharacterized protein (DUF1697 family)